MANEFEEILKGQEILGTMGNMSSMGTNKILHMIFMVDTSYSMDGSRIQNVNTAFHEMVAELQKIQRTVGDEFELYISILTFGSNAKWVVTPTPILDYVHQDLEAHDGSTAYDKAFRELELKLTRHEFMAHKGKIAKPYIMFMTDGYPDNNDYTTVLKTLEKNPWYIQSQRYAVLIGKDAIHNSSARSAVEAFVTDDEESIITAEDATEIVSSVSAATLHTIKNRTIHNGAAGKGDEVRKNTAYAPNPSLGEGTNTAVPGESPFGKEWDFDPSDVYGGNFNF